MAKRANNVQATTEQAHEQYMTEKPPEGFQKRTTDVVGFWKDDGHAIFFIPRSARIFDGNIDAYKPSMLIVGELLAPVTVTSKDAGEFLANKGDMIGVWGKPGMRSIRELGDVAVWMKFDGERDIGKGNPMRLYDIRSAKVGRMIPVTEDSREKSLHTSTFLDKQIDPAQSKNEADVPF